MKVFISYGHNDHTNLVDALFDALIEAGHEPWKDDRYEGKSGIAPGEDFTRVIFSAIDASDFVIAFVTPITQERQYCRDERNYAYNRKGSHYIQIRLDNANIDLGNSRSYIDMSDVEESTGEINPTLFKSKLGSLFAAFRDPESFAEGGLTPWSKFETHLKVPGALKYSEFVAKLEKEDYVGREWLREKCRNWVKDASIPCRLFVILGEAGTGKTAFVRSLAADRELVRSVHICVYDLPSTRTAQDTLKDLAYTLAQNYDPYFQFLKTKDLQNLADLNIDALFEFLFIDPLKTVQEKFLLIIDGLDELDERSGFNPLMQVFRQFANKINPNISFLVTGRPDDNITHKLNTIHHSMQSILLDKDANRDDLVAYIRSKLEQLNCYTDKLSQRLLKACDGNFEYLSLLFKEAEEEGLAITEETPMPKGLYACYTRYLDRRMEMANLPLRFKKEQHRLLSVLCAAYEPLPLSLLADFAEMERFDVDDELHIFGSLIRQTIGENGEPLVSLFTKGFRDFLTDKSYGNYRADEEIGSAMIGKYVLSHLKCERDFVRIPYLDRNGFNHLLHDAKKNQEEITEYLNALGKENSDAAAQRMALALVRADAGALSSFVSIFTRLEFQSFVIPSLKAIRAKDTMMALALAMRERGLEGKALILEGDTVLLDPSPEAYKKADELFCKCLKLYEKAYAESPSFATREDYIIICDRMGTSEKRKNTPEARSAAEMWYRKTLELEEINYKENPCYRSRRGLAIAYGQVGILEEDKNTPEGRAEAEKWYRKRMELSEQNYAETPCYQSRWELSAVYLRLGDLEKKKSTPEGRAEAEKWYRKRLELSEQNYAENPCFQSRHSIAVVYERLGGLERGKSTPEGRAEAEKWYRKEADLFEQNYAEDPCYQSRHSLAVVYELLGLLEEDKNTPEGRSAAEAWFRKEIVLMEQNYAENPCYQSKRSLAIVYERLGSLEKKKNTPEGRSAAEEWFYKQTELLEQNYAENPCYESRRALAIVYELLGLLENEKNTPEGKAAAEEWFRKEVKLTEQNYAENPCYESRRSLGIVYERLGDLEKSKNTPKGRSAAEVWFQKEAEIMEQNYADNPCYESRRGVAIVYGRLGALEELKGTPMAREAAAEWYRKSLPLNEKNYAENPCYTSRHSLAINYESLGNLEQLKGTPEGRAMAEGWYRYELMLEEQNYKENPCYTSRLSLIVVYERLGNLESLKNTPEGRSAAEAWFRKEVELAEQNYADNPCYISRRSLGIACERLGDCEKGKKTPEGYKAAEEWYRREAELMEQNYAENPCYESRRGLALPYSRLGSLEMIKGTPEARKAAEEWFCKALALNEKSHADNPCFHSRLGLAINYEHLGDLEKAKGTDEGRAMAEGWYRYEVLLLEQNFEEDPSHQNRQNLIIAYDRLGNISPAGRDTAIEWFREQVEMLEKQNPDARTKSMISLLRKRLDILIKKPF